MKKLKIWAAYFASLFSKKQKFTGKPLNEGTLDALSVIEALWAQRQLDDLLLVNQQILHQLKQKPFHGPWLEKRDKVQSDINNLQPIVASLGMAVANHFEKRYGVEFYLLTGRPIKSGKSKETDKSLIVTP